MLTRTTPIAVALLLVVTGCSSSDPTASEEYAALELELAQTEAEFAIARIEAQLEKVTAERDALAAANEALSEQPTGAPVEQVAVTTQATLGTTNGRTVSVTISGLEGLGGQALAGVLYEGDDLSLSVNPWNQTAESQQEAEGGFDLTIGSDDFTTTQLVRQPAGGQVGPFPYVTADAVTVEPGVYTLVLWADYGLSPISRWVPVNSDGQGLTGCQHVFEVGADDPTEVLVGGELSPDGWDVACTAP
jgi:hypothetical protein